jgi:hypothetical protein
MAKNVLARLAQIGKDRIAKVADDISDPVCYVTKKDRWVGVRVVKLVPDRLSRLAPDKVRYERCFS